MISFILLRLVYILVKLFSFSYRFSYINKHYLKEAKQKHPKGGHLIATWHQNAIAAITSQIGNPHSIIISRSKDGEFVAYTCKKLGHIPVRGSSHRGGSAALNEMIELILKDGTPGAITVDGPKGPLKSIKPGIFEIARKTKCMIVPYSAVPKSYWEFNSWDKFRLPKPFTKIILSYGPPISVETKLNDNIISELKKTLTKELDDCEQRALDYHA